MKIALKCKKIISFLFLFGLITLLMIPNLALAVDTEARGSSIQPRWSDLIVCDNYLDYASNLSKGLYVYGSTLVDTGCYAGVEIQLQRYVDSCSCWVNVPTYSWDAYAEDDYAEIAEDDISVASGIYRFKIVHTAHDTSGLEIESFIANSNEIRVP